MLGTINYMAQQQTQFNDSSLDVWDLTSTLTHARLEPQIYTVGLRYRGGKIHSPAAQHLLEPSQVTNSELIYTVCQMQFVKTLRRLQWEWSYDHNRYCRLCYIKEELILPTPPLLTLKSPLPC